MTPELKRALKNHTQWFGSYKKSGELAKVQVWLVVNSGRIEFLTSKDSYKVRRVQRTQSRSATSEVRKVPQSLEQPRSSPRRQNRNECTGLIGRRTLCSCRLASDCASGSKCCSASVLWCGSFQMNRTHWQGSMRDIEILQQMQSTARNHIFSDLIKPCL